MNCTADEAVGLDKVIATFAAANSREASPLERQLLGALVEEVDAWARAVGSTGASWVAAAVVEAVESGSRYVAPRRIREICRRWAREGVGKPRTSSTIGDATSSSKESGGEGQAPTLMTFGHSGTSTVGGGLAPRLAAPHLRRHKDTTYGRRDDSDRSSELRAQQHADDGREELAEPALDGEPAAALAVPTFVVDEALGLNNRQLWAAVLDELRRGVPAGTFATWLKPTRLVGLADDGALVVGAPNSFAREWLRDRLAAQVEAVVGVVLGHRRGVRFEVEREWLARPEAG